MSDQSPGRFGRTFVAFRNRNFRLFWIGQLISNSGNWMQKVAQAWLVLQLTNSPLALGTVAALQGLPLLTLALFGGVLADRVAKRKLLIITQAIQGGLAMILAILTATGLVQLWHVYLLAVILGISNAFDNPTRQSFLMELAGPKDISNAVALHASLANTTRIIGPTLSGLLISQVGVAACFGLNALSFVAVIGALLAMRPSEFYDLPVPSRGPMLKQIRQGLSYSLGNREICLPVILLFVLGAFGYNFSVVLPLVARYVLDIGPFGLGMLFTSMSLGSVVMAVRLAARKESSERTMWIGALTVSLMLFSVAFSPWLPLTFLMLFAMGAGGTSMSSTATTRMQLAAPAELRGRVMSLFSLLWIGTGPFGSLLLGTLSEHLGVRQAISASALICGLGVLAGAVYVARKFGGSTALHAKDAAPVVLAVDAQAAGSSPRS